MSIGGKTFRREEYADKELNARKNGCEGGYLKVYIASASCVGNKPGMTRCSPARMGLCRQSALESVQLVIHTADIFVLVS